MNVEIPAMDAVPNSLWRDTLAFAQSVAQGLGIWVRNFNQQTQIPCLDRLGLSELSRVEIIKIDGEALLQICLKEGPLEDTRQLGWGLGLMPFNDWRDLEREIVLSMLGAPQALLYPNLSELESAIRIRLNIVDTARRAQLDFHTEAVDRPQEYWAYRDGHGFLLRPGKSLIEGLKASLHPDAEGRRYAFSCYRATEYVMLLGIATELQRCNPRLLLDIEERWRSSPIASREFHDTFLREQGSLARPLPGHYYIPGDRVWFRNPDECSSDVSGYEGSWLIYLGGGYFANFWDAAKPYTLAAKCVELYHWRDAVIRDSDGHVHVNEALVAAMVSKSMSTGGGIERILERMTRFRDASGVYDQGGCLDPSREHALWVHPGTSNIKLLAG